MKTNNNTTATSQTNSFVIVAGIVIAFICSLVLFQNANASAEKQAEVVGSFSINRQPANTFRLPNLTPTVAGASRFVSILLNRN